MPKKYDYSGWSKEDLIKRIHELEKRKKYGLVWDEEREPEKVVLQCKKELPVLKEVKEKEIKNDPDKPTHILIEGDNYHALSVLSYTHENSADFIYIDPPYNTGKPDNLFIYNDRIVDANDTFRHSKWLNFMSKRLKLARNIMKPSAPIFISIDDNEIANLKLLCNEIFGENNFIACLPTIMNLKGNQDQFGFAGTHEYTLVYCKDKNLTKILEFDIEDEDLQEWHVDEFGYYKKGANLKSTGVNAPREKRPFLFYPILINNETLEITSINTDEYRKIYNKDTKTFDDSHIVNLQKKYEQKGYTFILPITNNEYMTWRWQREKIINEPYNIIVIGNNGNFSIYKKQRPSIGDMPTKKPKTLFYKPEYSSGNGTAQIKNIFGKKVFNNPKPIDLIKDFLKIGANKDALIVDFFAGSGTTLHATLELNEKDGGQRQCILVTNNENNICEDVTYVRAKKVLNGYQKNNGENVIRANPENLKYYQTDFVPAKATDENKEKLTKQSVEMLCLRENTFDPFFEEEAIKIFQNKDKYTAILFDQLIISKLKQIIKDYDKPVHVYIFSLGDDDFADEFSDMKEKVTVKSIPAAILRVYRRIFK